MQTVQERVDNFLDNERPQGAILEPEQCLGLALKAARLYSGYGDLAYHAQQQREHAAAKMLDPSMPELVLAPINAQLPLSDSDWAVISPLWLLYMERERASLLEATRIMGDVTFGRASSEINTDIQLYESDMHVKAFSMPVVTI